ncbi:MAG TPA: formate dehydrogenase accessory protein FdhE [Burkholderiales bacterium]|nr:formate dehydrogenase accessory protein FdhE [Burkholderiales bacterium]
MKRLEEIELRNPEWAPWLAIIGEVLAEIGNRDWDEVVPAHLAWTDDEAPLLAGAALPELRPLEALYRRLASRVPGEELREAIALIAPMPFLHACRRRFADALPASWSRGYCPICGRWPALAEVCGVERLRYLRCGACGAAWRAAALSCAYCGATDHHTLGGLVAESGDKRAAIETCAACRGYLKCFSRLSAGAPAEVMLEDLASVELDLAAAGRGYARPESPGYPR